MMQATQIYNHADAKCRGCEFSSLCREASRCEALTEDGQPLVRRRLVEKGEFLFRRNSALNCVSVVCSGSAKSLTPQYDGLGSACGFYFPGEMVGLEDIDTGIHSRDTVALEDLHVRDLCYPVFFDYIAQSPGLYKDLLECYHKHGNNNYVNRLALTGKFSAAAQLASFLLNLASRSLGHGTFAEQFRLSMSRTDISNYLGLATETVSRLLQQFQKERLLDVRGRSISILKPALLRSMTGQLEHHPVGKLSS